MSVSIKNMTLPICCAECWALDEYGDYPVCRITQEQRGYNFNVKERRMDKCPLEVEPTKHGRWSEKHYCSNLTGYDYAVICSECEKPTYRQFAEPTPDYCPSCGARMDAPNNAHWIKQLNEEYKCSVCGDTTLAPLYECGTCGAKMYERR